MTNWVFKKNVFKKRPFIFFFFYLWTWNEHIAFHGELWTYSSVLCPSFHRLFIVNVRTPCVCQSCHVSHNWLCETSLFYDSTFMNPTSIHHICHVVLLHIHLFFGSWIKFRIDVLNLFPPAGVFSALQQPWQGEEDSRRRGPRCSKPHCLECTCREQRGGRLVAACKTNFLSEAWVFTGLIDSVMIHQLATLLFSLGWKPTVTASRL